MEDPEKLTTVAVANIEEALRRRGLNKSRLSELTGINQPDISRLFKPGRATSLSTLSRVASALNVNVAELIGSFVPLLGVVGAGPAVDEPAEHGATLAVSQMFRDCVAYQVRGDSMESELIGNGDFVIVRENPAAEPGEKVVAYIDELGTLVKKLGSGGTILTNPKRKLTEKDRVFGALVGVVRKCQNSKK